MKQVLLACPPTDPAQQRRIGIVAFKPGPDQSAGSCERCGAGICVGPRIKAAKEANADAQTVCFECAIRAGGKLQHLGGTGGSYLLKRTR
jgi:hypothetical protein